MIVVLLTGFASPCIAEKETATFSGSVVDTDGNPIAGLPVFIAPAEIEGEWIDTLFFPDDYSEMRRADTDANGQFSIINIPQGSVYFGVLPYNIDKRLPNDFEEIVDNWVSRDWRKITQADIDAFVAKGFGMRHSDFEPDVEILSLRVQGHNFLFALQIPIRLCSALNRVHISKTHKSPSNPGCVFARESFLRMAHPSLTLICTFAIVPVTWMAEVHRHSGGDIWTDTDGYFVYYLDEKDNTAHYTFSIEYQGLSAEAAPVQLEPGATGLTA